MLACSNGSSCWYGLNRRLSYYYCYPTTFVPSWVELVHACNATSQVPVGPQFQPPPWWKDRSDEHLKTPSRLANRKSMRYHTPQQSSRREKLRMKTESTALARQRETKYHKEKERERVREREREREWTDTDLELCFWFFVVVLRRACLLVLSSKLRIWCETPFWNFLQHRGRNFRLSLRRRDWCSTAVFTLSRPATNPFLFRPPSWVHSQWLSFLSLPQPTRTRRCLTTDTFPFPSTVSAAIQWRGKEHIWKIYVLFLFTALRRISRFRQETTHNQPEFPIILHSSKLQTHS